MRWTFGASSWCGGGELIAAAAPWIFFGGDGEVDCAAAACCFLFDGAMRLSVRRRGCF